MSNYLTSLLRAVRIGAHKIQAGAKPTFTGVLFCLSAYLHPTMFQVNDAYAQEFIACAILCTVVDEEVEAALAAHDAVALGGSAGLHSVAVGGTANNSYSVAVGRQADARNEAVALGFRAIADEFAVALGLETQAEREGIAIGYKALSQGALGIAIGSEAYVWEEDAIAIGGLAQAYEESIAIGHLAVGESRAVVLGSNASAGDAGAAIGYKANAATSAIALGDEAFADNHAIALGELSKASEDSIAIGNGSVVSDGSFSLAIGDQASVQGGNSIALGNSASTIDESSIAIGRRSQSTFLSIAIGEESSTMGQHSLAIGYQSSTSGDGSMAIGEMAAAGGKDSIAFGDMAVANGENSIAIGSSASTGSDGDGYAIALGSGASASGDSSIALGRDAEATGINSIVLGRGSTDAGWDRVFVAGSDLAPITDVYFGSGFANRNPSPYTIHGTNGYGTNNEGADIALAGGAGTGSAVGGDILFQTAPAGSSGQNLNGLITRAYISHDGAFGMQGMYTGQIPAVSESNNGRIYFDADRNQFMVSEDGSAWAPLMSGGSGVESVFGQTGVVTAQAGHYSADQITNVPSGSISSTDLQGAINELDAEVSVITDVLDNAGGGDAAHVIANSIAINDNAADILTNMDEIAANAAQIDTNSSNTALHSERLASLESWSGDVLGEDGLALGVQSQANTQGTSVGKGASAGSQAVAIGHNASAADGAIAIGQGATATGSVAIGQNAVASNGGTALGDNSRATGENSVAVGDSATATGDYSVALGAGSIADESNTVSVGSANRQRRVTNVAPGVNATDAVNMSQFMAAYSGLENALDHLENRAFKGIAISNAIQVFIPPKGQKFAVSAMYGHYADEGAMGFSISGRVSDNVAIVGGVGFDVRDANEVGGKVGVVYSW